MELAAIQKSLALLYTDSKLRSRFFTNPLEVREELGLSEQNIVELSTLSIEQVNLSATSLKRKRLGEVRELLPLTARVLGREFNKLFWQYAETYMPEGIRKHQNDAIAFAAFIAKNAELAASDRPWLNDLVRYERACLQVSETRVCFKVCIFSYRIDRLVENLDRSQQDDFILRKNCIAFWLRFLPKGRLRHLIF